MRVISHKKIIDFSNNNKNGSKALDVWYRIIIHNKFKSFAELRKVFPSADIVDDFTVFNIGGNKFRLIAAVHYNTNIIYIRHVLTHDEYTKDNLPALTQCVL
jgi:mRNA interferase HigB